MQSTTITYLPVPLPSVDFLPREQGDISADYLIGGYSGNTLDYERKITLSSGGQIVQMMAKDAQGLFTIAPLQDAYSIDGEFLGIQMFAPVAGRDGFEYAVRLFKNSDTRNSAVPGTASQVVLPDSQNNPPQVCFAEVTHQIGNSLVREVNFIGIIDIRGAFTARVTIRPGETVYLKRDASGGLVFQY